jgi:hypothetical protein
MKFLPVFLSVFCLIFVFSVSAKSLNPRFIRLSSGSAASQNFLNRITPMWGPTGHAAVAAVAQSLLTSSTQSVLQTLLPDVNGQIEQIASWADEIRSNPLYDWSHALHFINTPDWSCDYDRSRDCIDSTYGNNFCVDGAIQNYTKRVVDNSLGQDQQAEAAKFIVHFVGDIHQPLHCGNTGDLGGNDLKGTFMGKSFNLHAVWDDGIINQRVHQDFAGSDDSWTQSLITQLGNISHSTVDSWLQCSTSDPPAVCSQAWAVESVKLACSNAYVESDGVTRITNHFRLESDYYARNIPVVESQIIKGGVRLANVLNSILGGHSKDLQ